MNEYDIGLLQRRLELEQARIAMEEARDAKSLVRMTRDNEGNWSYTYTQNPEDVNKAQQNYEDKLHDLEKWNQDRVAQMQASYLQQLQDYSNYLAGLDINDEERAQRMLAKQAQLQEAYGQFLNQAVEDGAWITNEYGVQNHNLIDAFGETTLAIEGNFNSLNEMLDTFKQNALNADQELTNSYQEWYENREEILELAKQSIQTFASDVSGEDGIGKITKELQNAQTEAENLSDKMDTEFTEIFNNLKTWWGGEDGTGGLSGLIDSITKKNKTWQQTILDIIDAYGKLNNTKVDTSNKSVSSGGGGGGGGGGSSSDDSGGSGGGGNGGGKGGGNTNYSRTIVTAQGTKATYTASTKSGANSKAENAVTESYKKLVSDSKGAVPSSVLDQLRRANGFSTGGYTGAWGPEGRLAMLHEKELVLNKEDTANMLATVGFVRDLIEMISINATSSGGIGNLLLGGVASGGNYLDQNVTIHAEFPNATNHSEIEEAFQNLIGLAGQYAGRKQ